MLAVVDRDVVEPDRGGGTVSEADHVVHGPGVIDAHGVHRPRVDLVGPGVQVVVDAAGDEVGAGAPAVALPQPHPLVADVEDDPAPLAAVGRQGGGHGILGARVLGSGVL